MQRVRGGDKDRQRRWVRLRSGAVLVVAMYNAAASDADGGFRATPTSENQRGADLHNLRYRHHPPSHGTA